MRDQLKTNGWLLEERRRVLGVMPTSRLRPSDEDAVGHTEVRQRIGAAT